MSMEVDAGKADIMGLRHMLSEVVASMPEPISALDPLDGNFAQDFTQRKQAWKDWQREVESVAELVVKEGCTCRQVPSVVVCNMGGETVTQLACDGEASVDNIVHDIDQRILLYEQELSGLLLAKDLPHWDSDFFRKCAGDGSQASTGSLEVELPFIESAWKSTADKRVRVSADANGQSSEGPSNEEEVSYELVSTGFILWSCTVDIKLG